MLELKDFTHLPQLDPLFGQITQIESGLIIVAGYESRTHDESLPSGRPILFGLLLRQLLLAHPHGRAIVVAETRDAVRLPRRHQSQVEFSIPRDQETITDALGRARRRGAQVLIVERLTSETAELALEAARTGTRVISQLDTILRGENVAHQLLDLNVSREQLDGLAWVVAVQRWPTLCETCKQPQPLDAELRAELQARYPTLPLDGTWFRAGQCEHCDQTGYQGNIALFDIYRAGPQPEPVLPLEEYAVGLAAQGHLTLDQALASEKNELQRVYRLLQANERALNQTNIAFQTKLTELELANRVLRQQTDASIALQEVGHALIARTELQDLANYICQKARDLCGADRAILYLLRAEQNAEILAVSGWDASFVHKQVDSRQISSDSGQPGSFNGYPPGVPQRAPDIEGANLRAGLRVPLIAQQEIVGVLIFHSTIKPKFLPREIALLQSFADTSAAAIQRAGLIESLREKIESLEAAQREIAKKERLERELELARQVQQSMLPQIFPFAPGFSFWARSEPARQVGGDFYDVFLLDGNQIGIVIADVSDKGMPAALFMALTRSLILAEARRERSPYVVLRRVHRLLLELSQSMQFVTVFYGVLDGDTRTLTYVRAGHERPFLLREGTAQMLPGEGMTLGIPEVEDLKLTEEKVNLARGDRLVLYTDGIADTLSPNGEAFGLGRLKEVLEAQAHTPLAEMCNAVFMQASAHQSTTAQYDDCTLLAVEVK